MMLREEAVVFGDRVINGVINKTYLKGPCESLSSRRWSDRPSRNKTPVASGTLDRMYSVTRFACSLAGYLPLRMVSTSISAMVATAFELMFIEVVFVVVVVVVVVAVVTEAVGAVVNTAVVSRRGVEIIDEGGVAVADTGTEAVRAKLMCLTVIYRDAIRPWR